MASGLCVPHQQAAHMAAPTEGQNINKTLANGEPSTHDPKRTFARLRRFSRELLGHQGPLIQFCNNGVISLLNLAGLLSGILGGCTRVRR
jgi:hypothetical protein